MHDQYVLVDLERVFMVARREIEDNVSLVVKFTGVDVVDDLEAALIGVEPGIDSVCEGGKRAVHGSSSSSVTAGRGGGRGGGRGSAEGELG